MLQFNRDSSGLYLATDRASARVAFLFQDANQKPDSFQLTAQSWRPLPGFIAFFAPSTTRDWNTFEQNLRGAFTSRSGSRLGWFPEPVNVNTAVFVNSSVQGSAQPTLTASFSLRFSTTLTCSVQYDRTGQTTVTFDESTNSIKISKPASVQPQLVQLQVTPPGTTQTYPFYSLGPVLLPLDGLFPGCAQVAFPAASKIDENALNRFETGVMFFSQGKTGTVTALRYPMFRAPVGTSGPFNFQVSLDVLSPLDGSRTYFQFTDKTLGSYFATSMAKPLALNTVASTDSTMSRLVFAVRPVSGPNDTTYYYLTPAGQFSLALDGQQVAGTLPVQMLCGVTGTESLRIAVGTNPDALRFVPGKAAWQIPLGSSTPGNYLNTTATTSWAQIVTTSGGYISQPERSPLFSQQNGSQGQIVAGAPVYVLGFEPTDSWNAHEGPAQPAPLVPYAGLNFAANPNLKIDQYHDMEANALNPTRADQFVKLANMQARHARHARRARLGANGSANPAMTPQGMLVSLTGSPPTWDSLQIAKSNASTPILRFDHMGAAIQAAVQKNQIFTVISTDPNAGNLFNFDNSLLEIGDWTFDLSPAGTPAPDDKKTPPIFIMKFYPGKTIEDLINTVSLWSQPDTFNTKHPPGEIQNYLQGVIAAAKNADSELYDNFVQVVTDPAFSGILAVNCNIQLDALPTAIKAVLGGMKQPGISAFRAHHVGVAINDTDPTQPTPTLAKSSMFGLVDYEGDLQGPNSANPLDYEVEYLRALFVNSELRTFSCKVDLYAFSMFLNGVKLEVGGGGDDAHTIVIMGSYQSQGGDDDSSGEGVYSFVSDKTYTFDFDTNKYLDNITLAKVQLSFDSEVPPAGTATTTTIASHFAIQGGIKFKQLDVLDVFSIDQLAFSELAIGVSFTLTVLPGQQPSTVLTLPLSFEPGNLRLDIGATQQRSTGTSLLKLLPFKLKSFFYSAPATPSRPKETLEDLNYFSLKSLPGFDTTDDTFDYALGFDLDLGSMGGLVSSLSAFKFGFLIGWTAGGTGIAFGVQMPEASGKLEIKIEGVLTISIEYFTLVYATESDPKMLVVGMQNCYFEVLGKRLPPGENATFSLGLFAPTQGADQIGWIAAYNQGEDGGGGEGGGDKAARRQITARDGNGNGDGKGNGNGNGNGKGNGNDGSSVFKLDYFGLGQRVGPPADDIPKDFDGFLDFMKGDFWNNLKDKDFDKIYHPEGKWIALTHFTLLEKIELGFIFYDTTPFYSLQLAIIAGAANGLKFEITYTKVTDDIGLFAAKLGLPDKLRTFQAGAASVTLPTLALDIYTNGNWKADLGFPDGDDWSVCFRVEAMAGPIPVTGSGGFYVASLSSATDPDVFKYKPGYPTILSFGLAARLGVGKDFTAGPLKAGVSLTFFGIIQGSVGYLTSGGFTNIFSQPDALSLQGQFGLIGEIYGSIDFVIISASVNVRLEASVGIILQYEPKAGNDGSVLLYVEASVSVSVTVSINCGLFTIHIGFSYDATFRFQWQLAGPSSDSNMHALFMAHARLAHRARLRAAAQSVPLCPGLKPDLPLTLVPDFTVVFPQSGTGVPWLVVSLAVEYDPAPAPPDQLDYTKFKPFEAVATQLATFALVNVLNLAGYDATVWLESDVASGRIGLRDLDQEPDLLTGWIDYDTLLGQLALFTGATLKAPDPTQAGELHATIFPMPPFVNLATKGRLNPAGQGEDFNYQFQAKNPVSADYLKKLDQYFNQLFVNRTSPSSHAPMLAARAQDAGTPLVQEIFLDYFKGLIRASVHELLVSLENLGSPSASLKTLFINAVAGPKVQPTPPVPGRLGGVAGQMASIARGGARLPTLGQSFTIPDGSPDPETNPLYALLWQEFPVGGFADSKANSYAVTLSNPDGAQGWLTGSATYAITNDDNGVKPFTGLNVSQLTVPGTPTPIAQTQTGPQSFPFRNAIVWTVNEKTPIEFSLRPFPPNLVRLQISEAQDQSNISVLVKSRSTDGAYLADGALVPAGDVTFATMVNLTVKQIPAKTGSFLPDVFALSGASQADEALLGQILDVLKPPSQARPVVAIQVLYPTPGQSSGLTSAPVNLTDVFVLRTNTTTVSQPPPGALAMVPSDLEGVAVAATLDLSDDGGYGFLQIIQQATVTNAPGYYLRYIDKAGNYLDPKLFATGPATLTLLVTYQTVGSNTTQSPLQVAPYYNAISFANWNASLLYYAETTDPALDTRYLSLAVGTAGVTLDRADNSLLIAPNAALAAAIGNDSTPRTLADLIPRLKAHNVADPAKVSQLLADSGSAIARLNSLYGLVAYQIDAYGGFDVSHLSIPVQSQKPSSDSTTSTWRIVAPLYSVAAANAGYRYAGIPDPFRLSLFVTDAFGNQLPAPQTYSGTNYYFDPIVPLDQWQGIQPSYDFSGTAGLLTLHLVPKASGFADLAGGYTWSGTTVTATTATPHRLATGDVLLVIFTADQKQPAPANGIYRATKTGDTTFTITVTASGSNNTGGFGAIRADLSGGYTWSGTTVTATTAAPHGLAAGVKLQMTFIADSGQGPANGVYPATPTGDNTFTVTVTASGSGTGGFGAMRQDANAASSTLTHYRAIHDQITGPGVSFEIETNLALQGTNLVAIPVSAGDAANVIAMVKGVVDLLSWNSTSVPAQVDISVPVPAGALPPLFQIAVLFGIERDSNMVQPNLPFPSAHHVSTAVVPVTALQPLDPAYKSIADFAKALIGFSQKTLTLALGMTGTATVAPQLQSKAARARRRLKKLRMANDGTSSGTRTAQQSLWAVSAALLDVSIGAGSGSGPRFLSPKPLDNVLNSGTVPLPTVSPLLPPPAPLPAQQTFVDVDLDQINRVFFQAVDNVLSPASAAKAYEADLANGSDNYATIAVGREKLAQRYSLFEIDWLFPAGPFTGGDPQKLAAINVFEQQMRAALMTAYSVDTIVQYDVAWNQQISSQADGNVELFGQVEATLNGSYVWSNRNLVATTKTPHGLSVQSPPIRVLMIFTQATGQTPVNGIYPVTAVTTTTFTVDMGANGSGSGSFSGVRQNAGLSSAHVAANSKGSSLLTFLYGNPDVAAASTVTFDLRFNVSHLQYFLAPDNGSGGARPSIWLQLVTPTGGNPTQPHIGPAGALTTIPVVLRQYPTSPTFVGHSWKPYTPKQPSGNPIADEADWSYIFTYQAALADQDQINAAITYNTDLRPSGGNSNFSGLAGTPPPPPPYTLFQALARFSAVNGVVAKVLPNYDDPAWNAAVQAFAASVHEVADNLDWTFLPAALAGAQPLVKLTDNYVVTDKLQSDRSTRLITLQWLPDEAEPPRQLSSFPSATLSVKALNPKNKTFPDYPSSAYPNQTPVTSPPPPNNAVVFKVPNAPPDPLIGVAHRVKVAGLNLLAAENAVAAVQIERNLISLKGPDGNWYEVVNEFIYTTALVRPSQPLTPYIDNEPGDPAQFIDVAKLTPVTPRTLYQRIYNVMRDLLADAVQARALYAAYRAAGVTGDTKRRVKVSCSYQFPVGAIGGATNNKTSFSPLVPVVMARSFDIDAQDPAALSSFATLFAAAIAGWAHDHAVVFGSTPTLKDAALRFDITLYAKLAGVNTPVLRLNNLQLKVTDIDTTAAPARARTVPA